MQRARLTRAASGGSLAVVLMVVAGAGPTLAGFNGVPDPVTAGKVGPWSLLDTEASPSVVCTYDDEVAADPIASVSVRAPRVRWPDTRPRAGQKGKVRWRIVLESTQDAGTSFQPMGVRRTKTAIAREARRAPFTPQELVVASELESPAYFRVRHRVQWLRGDGSVRGSVVYWSEMYAYVPPIVGVQVGGCGFTR